MVSFWQTSTEEIGRFQWVGRRYLVLNLPRWATDCLRRADPLLAASMRPLVLWEKIKGGMRVVALDTAASKSGIRLEQSLADARAIVPTLEMREIDYAYLEQVFADFADWHSHTSPIVSVITDHAAFGDLVLDITGVTHLFGGEEKMLRTVTGRLRQLGFSVHGAIASTVGAAWALAHFSAEDICAVEDERVVLEAMPVAGLRLDEAIIAGLSQMGFKTIGQLYGRDRKALQARFGETLITRLDQALGFVEERITPRIPPVERYVDRRFPDPIGLIDDVLMTARDLAIQLALQLEQEGLGAQSFHLFLYRVDHKVMTLSVNASRATREPGHIARLFANRAERLSGEYDAGFGIDCIRLAATSLSELDAVQVGAFETDDGAADLDRLYDRMTSRLGPLAVVRTQFVNTHIPERTARFEPAVARVSEPEVIPQPEAARPLRLLPAPEAISVIAEVPDGPPAHMVWRRVGYKFLKAAGPERIEAEWRRTDMHLELLLPPPDPKDEKPAIPGKPAEPHPREKLAAFRPEAILRDYYMAEDEGGRRFWLFRQGVYGLDTPPRWFLHGFFT